MKLKKVMSLFLALVMSFALAAPAFAAEPDDGDEGIMPLYQVYPDVPVSCENGGRTPDFTTTPSNGKYLHVWFQNKGSETVRVILRDSATHANLDSIEIPAGVQNLKLVYEIKTPDKPCTFYLRYESQPSGAWITGRVAVAQYTYA